MLEMGAQRSHVQGVGPPPGLGWLHPKEPFLLRSSILRKAPVLPLQRPLLLLSAGVLGAAAELKGKSLKMGGGYGSSRPLRSGQRNQEFSERGTSLSQSLDFSLEVPSVRIVSEERLQHLELAD